MVFLKEVLKKLILKKKSADDNNCYKSIKNYPACKELFTCGLNEIIQGATCMCVFVELSIVHKIDKKR